MKITSNPIFLWAHPRSISTAFERIFIERGDFNVIHEPFSQAFFFGGERGHARFADQPVQAGYTFKEIWDDIERVGRANGKPCFVKELAFHMRTPLRSKFLSQIISTFLIRHPEKSLASMYKKLPDFDWIEAGYESLYEIYEESSRLQPEAVIVFDADDLLRNPVTMLKEYCSSIGVAFLPHSLSWEPKVIPAWKSWEGWHDEAQYSNGLMLEAQKNASVLPDRVHRMIERAMPIYQAMKCIADRTWHEAERHRRKEDQGDCQISDEIQQ
ncbi:hypothetical protein ACJU26_12070 [Acidithiobacillus sp. M4-SHS-6]|uniref:sulfotransferase-like domain-containing protein n=1 Tax=Acidithiobacillus sp. M4-SHS-6 TaxID=3383024 RepID=UPI0039BDBF7B